VRRSILRYTLNRTIDPCTPRIAALTSCAEALLQSRSSTDIISSPTASEPSALAGPPGAMAPMVMRPSVPRANWKPGPASGMLLAAWVVAASWTSESWSSEHQTKVVELGAPDAVDEDNDSLPIGGGSSSTRVLLSWSRVSRGDASCSCQSVLMAYSSECELKSCPHTLNQCSSVPFSAYRSHPAVSMDTLSAAPGGKPSALLSSMFCALLPADVGMM